MELREIADLALVPRDDGRITVVIDSWHYVTTTLTVAGAEAVVAALQEWIAEELSKAGRVSAPSDEARRGRRRP